MHIGMLKISNLTKMRLLMKAKVHPDTSDKEVILESKGKLQN
jgi:hypothetical protein